MLSSPERPWIWLIWRALPPPLRRRVTARRSLLWLVATAALFVTCLASFLVWVGEDRSVTLTPSSGHYESAPPGDWGGEQPTEEAPAEEAPAEEEQGDEAPAEEEPGDEAPADEAAAGESASVSPSMLPIVVSGVSGFGGLLSGVAAMMTARQAADKGRRQQAPGCTHGRRPPEHRQLDRDDACRRG